MTAGVVDTVWFNCIDSMVGIVAVESDNGEVLIFIGSPPRDLDEHKGANHIVLFGAPFPKQAAQHFFPWLTLDVGF